MSNLDFVKQGKGNSASKDNNNLPQLQRHLSNIY